MQRSDAAKLLTTAVTSCVVCVAGQSATAATYIFASGTSPDIVTHANGYDGTGGNFEISIGIDETSLFATEIATSVQNVVNTWNGLLPTVGNLQKGVIPKTSFDFESVLLHEVGHALGLNHTNLASESGESGSNREFARAGKGANGVFDLDAGSDGVVGTADDLRGDDVNLNYFRIGENDPFATELGTVDSTTYSRDIADLPTLDTFTVSGGRDAAAELGYAQTEAVMEQGTRAGEIQRSLTADDVVGIRYAQSGIDELAGTADDYTFTLNFIGSVVDADILIDFDSGETGFAVTKSSGKYIGGDHTAITGSEIFFNSGINWAFNNWSNAPAATPQLQQLAVIQPTAVPLPGAIWGMMFGLASLGGVSMRRKKLSA